jgi:lipid A 3-O-deacylase
VNRRCRVVLLFGCLLLPVTARSEDLRQGFVLKINEENDLFVLPSTDKHYTQGLHVTLLWPDDEVPLLLRPLSWLPDFGMTDAIRKYGGQIGQEIYTPVSTNQRRLVPDDRPYAGWLYLGLIRENRGLTAGRLPTIDRFQMDLGVVGPDSLAEDAQVWFHDLIGDQEPRGWRFQINNEPGIALRFSRRWRLWDAGPDDGLRAQLIPDFGASLGNIDTSARLGALMRVGYNIPDEFGPRVEPAWGGYIFGGVAGHAVLHNAFLDGNLISHSHSVSKEPAFLDLKFGVALQLRRVEIAYTYNYRSREFRLQDKHDAYGSLDFTYRF